MLREIISITGKPGLYKIVSRGKGTLIVEQLGNGNRLPVHARDRVVSLGDISMYTESGDTPLGEILDKVYAANDGKEIDIKGLVATKGLKDSFGKAVEDFDRDRVHDSDIKKLYTWYNILLATGYTKFVEEKEEEAKEEEKSEEKKED